ncbi:MAG: malonyl-ACP O-methyltransferase BioC [Gammaproteobacteria bacterium]|nr:malonyl-ACP O-methyltransferase BioC [Gammaproteobacteria bacterium]
MNEHMNDKQFNLDKSLVRSSFNNAAKSYEEVAILQREIGQRLLQRLELINIQPQRVIDIGAGIGTQSKLLAQYYKNAKIIALDLSINMLQHGKDRTNTKHHYVCGDAECLPFANESLDLIFSNLTLQWCNNLDHTFFELQRILKPGGLLIFSTLGPDTLHELRSSWKTVDDYNHVNAFMDMHDIGDAMIRFQLADPVMDVENIKMTYQDVYRLMKDLKSLGAHNVTAGRPSGLTTKSRIQKMQTAYEQYRQAGVLPATYEIVYGHAWKPDLSQIQVKTHRRRPDYTTISIDEIKRKPSDK